MPLPGQKNKMVEGLFTSIIDMNGEKAVSAVFNPFPIPAQADQSDG